MFLYKIRSLLFIVASYTGAAGTSAFTPLEFSSYHHFHGQTASLRLLKNGRIRRKFRLQNVVSPILRSNRNLIKPHGTTSLLLGKEILTNILQGNSLSLSRNSYILTRSLFLRAMAFVHVVAFSIALLQNKALIGDNGITPARHVLDLAQQYGSTKSHRRQEWRKSRGYGNEHEPEPKCNEKWNNLINNTLGGTFFRIRRFLGEILDFHPTLVTLRQFLWDNSDQLDRPITTLLWLAKDRSKLNPWLDSIAIAGILMSLTVMILGCANAPMVGTLWLCQRSLMSVGGIWYGYGWEPQLNELSFHSLFLVPLLNPYDCWRMTAPPLVIYAIRWHLFRVMIGAGLIKFRAGDTKWYKDYSAMNYFYQSQPIPNPASRYFHFMPKLWHKFEVVANHFVECVAPWLLIIPSLPSGWRRSAGMIQIVFQAILISSGNLSFLNWLAIVPAITCFDDAFLLQCLPSFMFPQTALRTTAVPVSLMRKVASTGFFALIATLSVPVVKNLMSKRQVMNNSYDPLRLVNTYGAFGTVNENRDELIISSAIDWENDGEWKEYEFKAKPGDIKRSPKWLSPYHHRLDWQMWVSSSLNNMERSPWLKTFLIKLLKQDNEVLRLLKSDPWKDSNKRPRYIRIDRYRYTFHRRSNSDTNYCYWDRELIGRFYPKQGLASIKTLKNEKLE